MAAKPGAEDADHDRHPALHPPEHMESSALASSSVSFGASPIMPRMVMPSTPRSR
jgi:hypothetical protein